MKAPFHYNINRTLRQRLDRIERQERWVATLLWSLLGSATVALAWLVAHWV